jgi:hypothetical protein
VASVTYQTIKLSKGKHGSPHEGACVMELASMLAKEPFGDHPVSVCPVIGSFLRAYNDSIDDERRQDLYSYAARVVGSRAAPEVQQARSERLITWASELQRRRWTRFFVAPRLRALALGHEPDAVGSRAVHAISLHNDRTHGQVLALIDELLAIGSVPAGTAGQSAGSPPPLGQRSGGEVGQHSAHQCSGDHVARVVDAGVDPRVPDQRRERLEGHARRR